MGELGDADTGNEKVRDAIDTGRCPDCDYRGFVIGPMAGLSINIECGNLKCRKKFNAAFWGGRCVNAHRLN